MIEMIGRAHCLLPVLGCRAVLATVCKAIIRKMASAPDENLAAEVRARGAASLKKRFFPADIENALCGFYGLRSLNPRDGFRAQGYPRTTAARS